MPGCTTRSGMLERSCAPELEHELVWRQPVAPGQPQESASRSPGLLDVPASLLVAVAGQLEHEDLGRLACCSRALRRDTYHAWPVQPSTALLAARHGMLPLLRAQLEAGGAAAAGAVDGDGRSALQLAAAGGHEAAARLLLDAGADANGGGARTALMCAAEGGHETVVRLLLGAGADANRAGAAGRTPLMCAAKGGHAASAQLLLAAGAEPDAAMARSRQTGLMWAAKEGHSVVAQLLVDAGADIGAEDSIGWTALHWACGASPRGAPQPYYGSEAVVRLLLDAQRWGHKRHCRAGPAGPEGRL